jgi:hypothetical protein
VCQIFYVGEDLLKVKGPGRNVILHVPYQQSASLWLHDFLQTIGYGSIGEVYHRRPPSAKLIDSVAANCQGRVANVLEWQQKFSRENNVPIREDIEIEAKELHQHHVALILRK